MTNKKKRTIEEIIKEEMPGWKIVEGKRTFKDPDADITISPSMEELKKKYLDQDSEPKPLEGIEKMNFRLECERMGRQQLRTLFNDLSKKEKDATLKPAERNLAGQKAKIAGLVLALDGHGAQG